MRLLLSNLRKSFVKVVAGLKNGIVYLCKIKRPMTSNNQTENLNWEYEIMKLNRNERKGSESKKNVWERIKNILDESFSGASESDGNYTRIRSDKAILIDSIVKAGLKFFLIPSWVGNIDPTCPLAIERTSAQPVISRRCIGRVLFHQTQFLETKSSDSLTSTVVGW